MARIWKVRKKRDNKIKFRWTKIDKSAPSARADFVRQWIFDLFKPEAKQAKGLLLRADTGGACCLGVACVLGNVKRKLEEDSIRKFFVFGVNTVEGLDNGEHLPEQLQLFLKMSKLGNFKSVFKDVAFKKALGNSDPCSLADANDKGWSFLRIGKLIRDFPDRIMDGLTDEEIEYIKATPAPKRDEYRAKRRLLANSGIEGQAPQIENKEVPPRLSKS